METLVLQENQLDQASALLKQGELVAFPTETVYGLGCIASSKEAFDKLVAVKRRSPDKPFTLMCCNFTQAMMYCEMDVGVRAVMQHFFPGEVTVLLKARANVPHHIDLGTGKIGIRIPKNPATLDLIERVDAPLLVPSANISSEKPEVIKDGVLSVFYGEIAAVIDGKCEGGVPSTIVDMSVPGEVKLVREGPVALQEIEDVYQDAFCSIAIGCDHGGLDYKNAICSHLAERGFEVNDYGTFSLDSCDYPDFGHEVAKAVARKDAELGIVVCTSGEGIMISCNKVPGVRAGIGYDDIATGKMREHNDANVVAFGQKYMKLEDVLRRVDIFLMEKFSSLKKHHRRVEKLEILD